jgi:hypothetical protein
LVNLGGSARGDPTLTTAAEPHITKCHVHRADRHLLGAANRGGGDVVVAARGRGAQKGLPQATRHRRRHGVGISAPVLNRDGDRGGVASDAAKHRRRNWRLLQHHVGPKGRVERDCVAVRESIAGNCNSERLRIAGTGVRAPAVVAAVKDAAGFSQAQLPRVRHGGGGRGALGVRGEVACGV